VTRHRFRADAPRRTRPHLARAVVPCLLLGILSACSLSTAKNDAISVADMYFALIKAGDLERVSTLFAKSYFKRNPIRKWFRREKKIHETLGKFRRSELQGWRAEHRDYLGEEGDFVILNYEVRYDLRTVTETLALFRARQDRQFKIVGHNTHFPESS